MEEFKLGPLQRLWLSQLEKYPERQTTGKLGNKIEGNEYRACCLGELHLCYYRLKKKALPFNEANINDQAKVAVYPSETLVDSFEKYGLYGPTGDFRDHEGMNTDKESGYYSLVDMNDAGVTWPEIAKFVRENPTLVFRESV